MKPETKRKTQKIAQNIMAHASLLKWSMDANNVNNLDGAYCMKSLKCDIALLEAEIKELRSILYAVTV